MSDIDLCSIKDCTNVAIKRTWCNKHYHRWQAHGDPTVVLRTHENHRKSHLPEWRTWFSMKQRCLNPNHPRYKEWGGRGITVCDEWLTSFSAFYKDMGDRPSNTHSIDRINNDGNYEPSNCRWATKSQQRMNQRKILLTQATP